MHMVLGEPPALFKDKINFKTHGGQGYGAHQDTTGGNWTAAASRHLSVLIPLDPMTAHNGPLQVAQGGWHRHGHLSAMYDGLNKTFEKSLSWLDVLLAPGELLFFDGFTPHRSSDNASPSKRRVVYLTYNAAREGSHHTAYYGKAASFRASPCDEKTSKTCRSFLPSITASNVRADSKQTEIC